LGAFTAVRAGRAEDATRAFPSLGGSTVVTTAFFIFADPLFGGTAAGLRAVFDGAAAFAAFFTGFAADFATDFVADFAIDFAAGFAAFAAVFRTTFVAAFFTAAFFVTAFRAVLPVTFFWVFAAFTDFFATAFTVFFTAFPAAFFEAAFFTGPEAFVFFFMRVLSQVRVHACQPTGLSVRRIRFCGRRCGRFRRPHPGRPTRNLRGRRPPRRRPGTSPAPPRLY